ncbi:hypothetical protein SLE2022_265820 [Rubroshorea leprosula]|uniref:Dynein light chain n=1 Tax=Rubroshorea leprosula TaxID=152421 RepID=A0AAV5J0K9_9ROSI|nr:hypothetical protein SLEP1_g18298 [Rubroshorea leprosula]
MATKEIKQKKGLLGFYKFNISGKNHIKAKQESVESTEAPKTEHKPVVNSLLLKKLENCQALVLEQGGRRRIERGGGGDGSCGGGRGGIVEARKSVSHVETNLSSVASFLQVKVLVSDMPGFMQVHAFRCARRTYDSLEKFSSKHMAYNMKKEFDKVYGPAWHCIVGSNFGSFVTHSTGCFLYFSMEKLYILIFKTKVRKVQN